MASLVAYASSDSEEDAIQPEKPAKIAKIEHPQARTNGEELEDAPSEKERAQRHQSSEQQQPQSTQGPKTSLEAPHDLAPTALGPSIPDAIAVQPDPIDDTSQPPSRPQSPYAAERERIQTLTLPTHPNFSIPSSPPPPTSPTRASALAASTKKFTRFLALKNPTASRTASEGERPAAQHFHTRLLASSALRNPELLPTLFKFAGLREEDQYAGTLAPESGGVPVVWREECYVEGLMRENETRRKRRERGKGENVEFVGAAQKEDRPEKRRREV